MTRISSMTGGFSGYASVSRSFSAGGGGDNYAGAVMLFIQAVAPTGWTQDTTYNDYALRVVSGNVGSGGSVNFSTVYSASTIPSGTVNNITLTSPTSGATTISSPMLPAHQHAAGTTNYPASTEVRNSPTPQPTLATNYLYQPQYTTDNATGPLSGAWGGFSHDHTMTLSSSGPFTASSALDLRIKYVDAILCSYPA